MNFTHFRLRTKGKQAGPVIPTPDQFHFANITDAQQNTEYTSNTITISGLGGATVPWYSTDTVVHNGVEATSGIAADGDTFAALLTSGSGLAALATNTLYVATVSSTYAVTTAESYIIPIIWGADTKSGQGAVNLGLRLPSAIAGTATASSLTMTSGNAAHWNAMPTNGMMPTNNSTGQSNRLQGGPYIVTGTVTVGGNAYPVTLTYTIETSITVPEYKYNQNRGTVPAYTFTSVASISTAADMNTYTTSAAIDDRAFLMTRGFTTFNINRANLSASVGKRTLYTSENRSDPDLYTQPSRFTLNNQNRYTFWKLAFRGGGVGFVNCTVGSGVQDTHILECSVGANASTTLLGSYPKGVVDNGTRTRVIKLESRRNFNCLVFSNGSTDFVGEDIVVTYCSSDSIICGSATYSINNPYIGNMLMCRPLQSSNHPDSFQLANDSFLYSGTFNHLRALNLGGPALGVQQGLMFGGDCEMHGDYDIYSLHYSDILANGALSLYGNLSFADRCDVWSFANVRAINGDLGISGSGNYAAGYGPQRYVCYDEEGDYIAGNENRSPAVRFGTFPAPPLMTLHKGYNQGNTPSSATMVNVTDNGVFWQDRADSSSPPDYSDPESIIPGLEVYFDDPYRIVSWDEYDGNERAAEAVYFEMYAPKVGGPLDLGDGTWNYSHCARRDGAPAKYNHFGHATLSCVASPGSSNNVTASISDMLDDDVICDVFVNGVASGVAITIPAGSTSAIGSVAVAAGQTVLLKNDIGLSNASAVA